MQKAIAFVLSALLVLGCVAAVPSRALADEASEAAVSEAQSRVEETAATYNDLLGKIDESEAQIEETRGQIAEIEAALPEQQAASNQSLIALYKMSQEGCSLLDMLLGARDINEFAASLDYINRIQEKNASQVERLLTMKSDLQASQDSLNTTRLELEGQLASAEEALTAAQEARSAAQAAAEEQKRREEEAAASAAAAEAAANPPADANTGSNVSDSESESLGATVSSDNVNWSADKSTFVNEWAGRINNYLSGSPMAGTGAIFAEAAWDYGVDPRWSPAISCIESGKGAICFLPYNAWGWGSISWDSWDEAIRDHVGGLSRGYGYTLTQEAAQKYCPPNWEFWYNNVASQMEMI